MWGALTYNLCIKLVCLALLAVAFLNLEILCGLINCGWSKFKPLLPAYTSVIQVKAFSFQKWSLKFCMIRWEMYTQNYTRIWLSHCEWSWTFPKLKLSTFIVHVRCACILFNTDACFSDMWISSGNYDTTCWDGWLWAAGTHRERYMYMDVHACMNLKIKRRRDWSIYELWIHQKLPTYCMQVYWTVQL